MTVGSKAQVFHGSADKTSGGLEKKHLKQTDEGRIVSKKQSKINPKLKAWGDATKIVMDARKGDKFVPLKKGSALYKKVKKEYMALLKKRSL